MLIVEMEVMAVMNHYLKWNNILLNVSAKETLFLAKSVCVRPFLRDSSKFFPEASKTTTVAVMMSPTMKRVMQ